MSGDAGLWICMTGRKPTCGQSTKRRGPDSCLETTRPRIAPGSLVPTSPICRRKDNRDHRTKADIDQVKKRKKPSPQSAWRNGERGTGSGERGAGSADTDLRSPLFVFRSAFPAPRSALFVVSHYRRSRRAVRNNPAVPMTIFASQHPSPSESFPSLPMLDPARSNG